jgi:hypothetical protein
VQQLKKKAHEDISYRDPINGITFSTKHVTSSSFIGNHVHFSGTAKLGKKRPTITFSVDVYDNGPGTNDQFFINASNGYSAGGSLSSGSLAIHR